LEKYTFYIDLFEEIDKKHNTEFTNRLYKNKHIFTEIYDACNNQFWQGCGSYLFDGQIYEYYSEFYKKQELLYNSVKNVNTVLEVGTYMGHSLLIMLLSNPNLKITCIDIQDIYAGPAVKILNKYFNNSITFIHGNSLVELPKLKTKFDFFHIDGYHENDFIHKEFNIVYNLNKNPSSFKIIFDDEITMRLLQNHIRSNYNVVKEIIPGCEWSNIYFEIKIEKAPPWVGRRPLSCP